MSTSPAAGAGRASVAQAAFTPPSPDALERFSVLLGERHHVLVVDDPQAAAILATRGKLATLALTAMPSGAAPGSRPTLTAEVRHLPFASGVFDGIWVAGALDGVARSDLPAALRELSRVLRQGILYLTLTGNRRLCRHELQVTVEHAGYTVVDLRQGRASFALFARPARPTTPLVGVNAILFDDQGRVLLVKRQDDGRWCLPGGLVECGEMLEAAIRRETAEETGLDVAVDRVVGVYSKPAPDHQYEDARQQIVVVAALCRLLGGTPRLGDETAALACFPLDDLPAAMLPGHERRIRDAARGATSAYLR